MESEGAEFLVLGHLLIEGVHCYKAYVNFPGYDLTAVKSDYRKNRKNTGEKPMGNGLRQKFSTQEF